MMLNHLIRTAKSHLGDLLHNQGKGGGVSGGLLVLVSNYDLTVFLCLINIPEETSECLSACPLLPQQYNAYALPEMILGTLVSDTVSQWQLLL